MPMWDKLDRNLKKEVSATALDVYQFTLMINELYTLFINYIKIFPDQRKFLCDISHLLRKRI